jgi:hypothetical protein
MSQEFRLAGGQSAFKEISSVGVSDPSEAHGRLIAASKVNGTAVYNTAGEKLGSVYDVM